MEQRKINKPNWEVTTREQREVEQRELVTACDIKRQKGKDDQFWADYVGLPMGGIR
jgi:hypothetical protein